MDPSETQPFVTEHEESVYEESLASATQPFVVASPNDEENAAESGGEHEQSSPAPPTPGSLMDEEEEEEGDSFSQPATQPFQPFLNEPIVAAEEESGDNENNTESQAFAEADRVIEQQLRGFHDDVAGTQPFEPSSSPLCATETEALFARSAADGVGSSGHEEEHDFAVGHGAEQSSTQPEEGEGEERDVDSHRTEDSFGGDDEREGRESETQDPTLPEEPASPDNLEESSVHVVEENRSPSHCSPSPSPVSRSPPPREINEERQNEGQEEEEEEEEVVEQTNFTVQEEKEGNSIRRKAKIESDDEEEGNTGQVEQQGEGPVEGGEGKPSDETKQAGGEEDDEEDEVGGLIADIFGASDAEHESDEEGDESRRAVADGREEEDGEEQAQSQNKQLAEEDEDEETGDKFAGRGEDFEWDFDVMLRRKKDDNRRQRKRRRDGSIDLISDADDQIRLLVNDMKQAAKDDRDANKDRRLAINKRRMLTFVLAQLRKADLQEAFVDCGMISAMGEWLAPLPDKSLPALEIRTEFLKILQQFGTLDQQVLKTSGIGKAVMLLLKHPKETVENKRMASKIISDWARPIFQLDTDYRSLSKEAREARDFDHMPKVKKDRLSIDSEDGDGQGKQQANQTAEQSGLRPGQKGWVGRARVPRPSTKDYVVRPKWQLEQQFKTQTKSKNNPLSKKLREFKTKQKGKKMEHAVSVSLSGKNM